MLSSAPTRIRVACARWIALASLFLVPLAASAGESHSTNIALHPRGDRLYVANREADSVTVFAVETSGLKRLAEVKVGHEPTCVAVRPSGEAFVTNAADGTVSVIGTSLAVIRTFPIGAEPRSCALALDGRWLLVGLRTAGLVAVIDARTYAVSNWVEVGGNPGALAVVDSRVFVTDFFARLIPGGPGEGFDDGKQGIVSTFSLTGGGVDDIALSPLADSGFTANRSQLCKRINPNANDTFCPDKTIADPANPILAQDRQAVFPNQLASAATCGGRLYLPSIGAQPEPPVVFNTNVQALVHVVDVANRKQIPALTTNLNAQIAKEPAPANPTQSLARLFGNDLAALDIDRSCKNLWVVSRGGNYVLRVAIGSDGKLNIGAPGAVLRLPTGNIPTGIEIHPTGRRAFVNNEVDMTVTVLDLESGKVLGQDVSASTPPAVGTFENSRLLGKLVFFTALGVPDNLLVQKSPREIDALQFRGKQSDNAWSTCASCHPDGLADGVTWIFADGPRQSIPLDGLYSKRNGAHDARINNWSAVRDSVTDFNNNSRNVQCGAGFAGGDPPKACNPASPGGAPNPNVFDHGISQGASEALDVETTWTQTVRALDMPELGTKTQRAAGAAIFQRDCAGCHGGAKWTKSEVLYLNDPALARPFQVGDTPRDPGLTMTANQSVSYRDPKVDAKVLNLLERVGTFDPTKNPIETRQNGNGPLGELGFNVPSLIGVGFHAPYFHNGSAQTFDEVFAQHLLPGGGTIANKLSSPDEDALETFLFSIDGSTPTFRSETDSFKEPLP